MLSKLHEYKTGLKHPNVAPKFSILIGPPGASKGLVGELAYLLIPETERYYRFVMSTEMRERAKGNDNLAHNLRVLMLSKTAAGDLIDNEPIFQCVEDKILTKIREGTKGFLLDGFPRNTKQGKAFIGTEISFSVYNIEVPMEISIERIKKRALKENRPDDADPQVVARRLEIYNDETRPLLQLLKRHDKNRFFTIDGVAPVRARVAALLRGLGFTNQRLHSMMRNLDRHGNPAHELLIKEIPPDQEPRRKIFHFPIIQANFAHSLVPA